ELRLEGVAVGDREEAQRVQRHVQLIWIDARPDRAAAHALFQHRGDLVDDGPRHFLELPAGADVPAAVDVLDRDQADVFRIGLVEIKGELRKPSYRSLRLQRLEV